MADKVVYNRYRSDSTQVETWMEPEGTVTVYPGGTVIARADSNIAKSRVTTIVQRNVELPDYSEQEDLEDFSEQEDELEVPQHENTNPTNTDPALGERTILTDAFDGSGGVGAVNTAAADPAHTQPETRKPAADLSPKKPAKEPKSTEGK